MANFIITGANQGIGLYLVKQLLEDGNKVAVLDLQSDNLAELKKEYQGALLYFHADVRNNVDIKDAVDQTISEFGTVDIAVHNACNVHLKQKRIQISIHTTMFLMSIILERYD